MIQSFGDHNSDCFLTYFKILKHRYLANVQTGNVFEYGTIFPDNKMFEC